MKIVPFERLSPDGTLWWKHEQGAWLKCEDAERESAKYQFGGYRVVRLNGAEREEVITGRSHFPNSDQWHEYEHVASKETVAASRGLQDALAESRRVVERFRVHSRA